MNTKFVFGRFYLGFFSMAQMYFYMHLFIFANSKCHKLMKNVIQKKAQI